MATKKQKKQQIGRPPAPSGTPAVPAASGLMSRLFGTAAQTAPLVGETVPEWSEDAVQALLTQLPAESRARFHLFVDQFGSLGSKAKAASERFESDAEAMRSNFKKKEDELLAARASVTTEAEKLNKEKTTFVLAEKKNDASHKQIESERKELTLQRTKIAADLEDIAVREATLRGGMVLDREKSLEILQTQIADLETRRDRLPGEINLRRQELMEYARSESDAIIELASKHSSELVTRELNLSEEKHGLDRRDEQLRVDEGLLRFKEKAVRADIEEEFQSLIDEKDARISRQEKERDRLRSELEARQSDLDEMEDLRELAGDDPQLVLEELESLRSANRQMKREIDVFRENQSQEDSTQLREQRDSLQDRLKVREDELFALQGKEHQWNRSVMDAQSSEMTRQLLEKRNALLSSAAQQLRDEVDQLIDNKKNGAVFPELSRMDLELSLPITTDPVPALADMVNDLQSRIAFAEKGKELHFQKQELQLFLGGLAMSHLHIFQGISGTGKTTLATAFAKAIGAECTVIPVQAGWRDRADLIGHYNAFEKRYYEKDTLQALYQAQTEVGHDKIHIVLLDEINLSRPEQYFAEFLSALEVSKEKRFINLMESRPASGAPALLHDGRAIKLPDNIWFIGTANHDETTNSFADKTHDRAFVLELPKQEPTTQNIRRPKDSVTWSFEKLTNEFGVAQRKHAGRVKDFLKYINDSTLTILLSDDFGLGWGNRLEQQLLRFVPVVLESGGSEGLAIDHMLASRMFRDGKVIGRHDVSIDQLRQVEDALVDMWAKRGLDDQPVRCLQALRRDIKRMERNG